MIGALRFTDSDFLGGAYIYDTGTPSLAVIDSAKTGSMLNFWSFYQPLGNDESFGEAFRQWFRQWFNTIAPCGAGEIAWHYGMTVAGDPFLSIGLEFVEIENVTELGDTGDEVYPRPVFADVTTPISPPVTGPELCYRAGGAGYRGGLSRVTALTPGWRSRAAKPATSARSSSSGQGGSRSSRKKR